MTYTPGPWSAGEIAEEPGWYAVGARGLLWCRVAPSPHRDSEADAIVIAAAPELYESLRDVVDWINQYPDDDSARLRKAKQLLAQLGGALSIPRSSAPKNKSAKRGRSSK